MLYRDGRLLPPLPGKASLSSTLGMSLSDFSLHAHKGDTLLRPHMSLMPAPGGRQLRRRRRRRSAGRTDHPTREAGSAPAPPTRAAIRHGTAAAVANVGIQCELTWLQGLSPHREEPGAGDVHEAAPHPTQAAVEVVLSGLEQHVEAHFSAQHLRREAGRGGAGSTAGHARLMAAMVADLRAARDAEAAVAGRAAQRALAAGWAVRRLRMQLAGQGHELAAARLQIGELRHRLRMQAHVSAAAPSRGVGACTHATHTGRRQPWLPPVARAALPS